MKRVLLPSSITGMAPPTHSTGNSARSQTRLLEIMSIKMGRRPAILITGINIPSYYSYDAAGWHFIALNSNCTLIGDMCGRSGRVSMAAE